MTGRSKKTKENKTAHGTPETGHDEMHEVKEEQTALNEPEEEELPDENPPKDRMSELENEIFEYRDKLIRKAAEFENYKKRTSEEFSRLINTANEELILKLLPVLDDINRFGKNFREDMPVTDLKKGVDLIFDKFRSVLISTGLKEIDAVGEPFDPELHEALMMIEKEGCDPDMVVDEHDKGYFLKDKVIRHSKVLVSK